MTPTFYTYFNLFQKTLTAFNQKCDCEGISATITFEQSLGTKNANQDQDLWVAKVSSPQIGDQRFGGTKERVSELLVEFMVAFSLQTLEACIANADEWFKDKPEVKNEVYTLHNAITDLRRY